MLKDDRLSQPVPTLHPSLSPLQILLLFLPLIVNLEFYFSVRRADDGRNAVHHLRLRRSQTRSVIFSLCCGL